MKALFTLLLMMSLLAMTHTAASAGPAAPACATQLRADDMCHAVALPTASAEKGKAGGICCELFPPGDRLTGSPDARRATAIEPAPLGAAGQMLPHWRPPRGRAP